MQQGMHTPLSGMQTPLHQPQHEATAQPPPTFPPVAKEDALAIELFGRVDLATKNGKALLDYLQELGATSVNDLKDLNPGEIIEAEKLVPRLKQKLWRKLVEELKAV